MGFSLGHADDGWRTIRDWPNLDPINNTVRTTVSICTDVRTMVAGFHIVIHTASALCRATPARFLIFFFAILLINEL